MLMSKKVSPHYNLRNILDTRSIFGEVLKQPTTINEEHGQCLEKHGLRGGDEWGGKTIEEYQGPAKRNEKSISNLFHRIIRHSLCIRIFPFI